MLLLSRSSRHRFACASTLAIGLVGCAARHPAPPPALEHVVAPAPPAEPVAQWLPIPLPPGGYQLPFLAFEHGRLVLDEVGARWFFPDDGAPPQMAPDIGTDRSLRVAHDVRGGLLVVTQDREVRITDRPLDRFRTAGALPADVVPESVVRFRDTISFVTADGTGLSTIHRLRGETRDVVAGPPGYRAKQVAIGADGIGAGLFLPESVHVTRDHGATWTPVPTGDLRVTALIADGPRVLLAPGGVRDELARAFDPQTGTLIRVHLRVPTRQTPRARRMPSPPSWEERNYRPLEELAPGMTPDTQGAKPTLERWHDVGGERGFVASDGDDVLVVERHGGPTRQFRRGRLGEGLYPIGESELDGCQPVSAALCDDLAAIACEHRVYVFRGSERIDRFAVEGPTELAFDAASHLLTVSRDPSSGTTRLRVLDMNGSDDRESRAVFEKEGALPRFVGGCHRPGLWLVNETRAARWARDGFEAPVSLTGPLRTVAVASDGSLLLSDSRSLLRFPDGTETPLGPHQRHHLSFADDGLHGLFVAPSGQVQQTDDGGATFAPITSPTTQERPAVRCGGKRCQLGGGAVREGFGRERAAIASWPPPAAPPSTRGLPHPDKDPSLPVAMRCLPDEAIFVPRAAGSKDRADALFAALWPRLGNTLFVGGVATEAGGFFGVFGDTSGRVERVPLPRMTVTPAGAANAKRFDARIEHFVQVVGAAAMTRGLVFGERTRSPLRWDARGPTFLLETTDGIPLAEPALIAASGVAVRRYPESELTLVGPHAPESRFYRSSLGRAGDGVLQGSPGGTWLAAETPTPTTLRLTRIPRAGAPASVDRELRVGHGEHGIGFGPEGTDQLALVEERADGGHELRLRPIGSDLSLGEAKAVPGASAALQRRLELPACGNAPSGGLVRLRDPVSVRVDVAGQIGDGFVNRLVRVGSDGACVERTVLARTDASLDALVVIAGNEGKAASALVAGGLRCTRVEALRSSPATTSSSASPPRAGSSASPLPPLGTSR